MISLYDLSTTDFDNNGDAIVQPIRCELTLSINGGWELKLELPYDEDGTYQVSDLANLPNKKTVVGKWRLIQENTVIGVDIGCVREQWEQGQTSSRQFFRIYDYRKSINSITAIAFPVACESTFDVLIQNKVFQNKTGVQVIAELNNLTDKYTLYTDITKTASTSFSNVNLNYAIASGDSGSFVDVWGGEIVYDNFNYNILSRIGDNDSEAHPVIYGRNMTGISYERDDSGLVTRIYPISQDGVYLSGDGYVDSALAEYYPVIHKRYMSAPYQLIIDDPTNPSATAQACATAFTAVQTQAASLSKTVMAEVVSAVGDGIPYGAIKKYKSEVVEAVAEMATSYCYHANLKSTMQKYIRAGMLDEINGMLSVPEPEMAWHGDYDDGWWYGDNGTFWSTNKAYARNEYKYISKKWSHFDDDGFWEAPKDDSGDWDWYQPQFTPGSGFDYGVRYGNFDRYRAVNEWIYITENNVLKCYWIDGDGWYDSEYTEESTWTWHGSGTEADPWWFGASDAASEDDYCHDQWVFIDGTLYYFDNNGYYDGRTKMQDYQWDWVVSGNKYWFGNAENHEYGALYLQSQWAKIGSEYYYFDEDGYVVDEETMINMIRAAFVQKMTTLRIGVEAQKLTLYNLLYQLMEDWAEKQFDVNHIDTPQVIITVNMVDLSKTNAYKDYQDLEIVCLGDSVDCRDYDHDIISTERIIGLTYDVIWEYNTAITIGHTEASLTSLLSSGSSGASVPSGFDTSAIESSLTTQGNAIAALQNGKQDKLTAGANISIVNNVISATGGGLQYWHETATRFYREGIHEGLSADGYIYTSCNWNNFVGGLIQGYEYQKLTEDPAIMGVFGHALAQYIVIVGLSENSVKWQWRARQATTEWLAMSSYPATMYNVSFTYNGTTWYASVIDVLHGSSSTGSVEGLTVIDITVMPTSDNAGAIYLAKHFIDVDNATDEVAVVTEIGTQSYAFKYGGDGKTFASIDIDGNAVFKEVTTDAGSLTSQMAAKQNALTAGANIQINGDIISATDTTYTAGDNIDITGGVISSPNDVLIGTTAPTSATGNNGNAYYKYNVTSETTEDQVTLPTFVDDQSTQVAITDFENYTKLKFVYTDVNQNIHSDVWNISVLPQTTNPDWGQGGDIFIANGYNYIVCGRDSNGLWIKECGNHLQELYACYEETEYEVDKEYVKIEGEWYQAKSGGSGGGGNITLLASPSSGNTSFPLNTNITLAEDMTHFDCIMFCPAWSGGPASIAYPPAIYPVAYFKALTNRAFTYYGTAGYNDVGYVNDTTVQFFRNAGETVCNAIYGIKY